MCVRAVRVPLALSLQLACYTVWNTPKIQLLEMTSITERNKQLKLGSQ